MGPTRRGWLRRWLAPLPLRPPGARAEAEFAALCIRCGRCIEVCLHRTLRPASWLYGPEAGTPVVEPAQTPCYLCMECPPACPTGALEPITEARQVRMGTARVDEETCYAHMGVLCRTCVDECPLTGTAIRQDANLRPVVTEDCVGCGVCESRCPVGSGDGDPRLAAIRVVPAGVAA